ncbi:FAD binding domain-containing protein [Flavihumibacter solisilvae]|uniref:Carbon monoxide dehydrogenase n=1 Tax=Flavihumibacter solisilvae TaxID=1349421 RepID=A0A0C1L4E2_9BACT|nr:xanthine dehydrogenase family protein subunit M [Flavihumibacter solisilvae]KIC94992.1 carbon monoxide dehydrogenase [Flavihumibacter solisilvae]
MIPAEFEYSKANTVDEAILALSLSEAKLLAGGHSLIPALKFRMSRPSMLVDISRIQELKGIHEEDGEIVIGAATTYAEIMADDYLRSQLPFLAAGTSTIGDMQVRNYGTIGGSLAHADPAADWPAMVLATDAAIEVKGPEGKRRINATDFFTGFFTTALDENEIITAIRIPVPPEGTVGTYQKFAQPASRYAMVGVAAVKTPGGKVRIGITGLTEKAFRASAAEEILSGKALDDNNIDAAVEAAFRDTEPMSDRFASAVYRKHLAKVYLRKALLEIA